jgi:hypothetical protein
MMSYRPVSAVLTLPPCPQHLSHREKTKKVMPQLKAVRVGAIRSGFVLLTFSRVHQNENGRRRRRRRREKEEEKHYGETNNPTILIRP